MHRRRSPGRPAAAQDDQPAGPRTPPQTPRVWPPPRRGLLPLFLRLWWRRRRQILLLQLPQMYSGGRAETAWPPSDFLLPSPPARGANPRVFLFNMFDNESYLQDAEAAFGLWLIGFIVPRGRSQWCVNGVLQDHGVCRFVDYGCYLCVFTPLKGRD